MKDNEKSYVYMYRVDGVPIYVGIGTEDNGNFVRARSLVGHKGIKPDEFDKVQIDVIQRNISRTQARTFESVLIQVLGQDFRLRNKKISDRKVNVRTIVADPNSKKRIVRGQVADEMIRKELVTEQLQLFSSDSGLASHNIFLEPSKTSSGNLVAALCTGYDPELDSLLTKFHKWWRSVGFDPMYEKVMIIVPWESQAENFRKATKDICFHGSDRPAVLITSVERWAEFMLGHKK